jgi:hypothetical protein
MTPPARQAAANPAGASTSIGRTICGRCAPKRIVAISGRMETYRIIPLGRAYRVEAVQANGQKRVVRVADRRGGSLASEGA